MLPPGVARAACRVERVDRRVVDARKRSSAAAMFERLLRDVLQHQHRVVRGLPPEGVVELAEHVARLGVPGPPQIVRELRQPLQRSGIVGAFTLSKLFERYQFESTERRSGRSNHRVSGDSREQNLFLLSSDSSVVNSSPLPPSPPFTPRA